MVSGTDYKGKRGLEDNKRVMRRRDIVCGTDLLQDQDDTFVFFDQFAHKSG